MVNPSRWKTRDARLSKLAFVLLALFPATLLVGFAAMHFEPPRFETRIFLSLDHPETEGQLINSGVSTLDMIVAVAVVVTTLGFVVGLVLLLISLYKRTAHATPTI